MKRGLIFSLLVLLFSSPGMANQQVYDSQKLLITVKNDGREETSILKSLNRSYVTQNTYDSALLARRSIKDIVRDYSLVDEGGWQINTLSVYCALVSLPAGAPLLETISIIAGDERVESVQPVFNYRVQTNAYNDPYFDIQYKEQARAISELHSSSTGRGVKIAVIDTGADIQHPELKDQIDATRNFVDDNEQRFQADIHGTAVAGIIAAKPGNGLGIVGLAPDAEVWVLKACWQLKQNFSAAQCNSFTLANAISYAIDRDADILNVSLSGPADALVGRLVKAAIEQGIFVIASDPVVGENRYPAMIPGVIGVRQRDTVADKSNDSLSIYVDGMDTLSTGPGGGFDFFSGSSMSAAIVSAYSALLIEKDQRTSPLKMLELIRDVHKLGSLGN